MTTKWTREEAFAHFGATPTNKRWSWSARGEEVVAMSLWKDQLDFSSGRITYHGDWASSHKLGAKEGIENIAYALEHLGGIFRVVLCTRDPWQTERSEELECRPQAWAMKITSSTGRLASSGRSRFDDPRA